MTEAEVEVEAAVLDGRDRRSEKDAGLCPQVLDMESLTALLDGFYAN